MDKFIIYEYKHCCSKVENAPAESVECPECGYPIGRYGMVPVNASLSFLTSQGPMVCRGYCSSKGTVYAVGNIDKLSDAILTAVHPTKLSYKSVNIWRQWKQ